jgi:hypothetical protein
VSPTGESVTLADDGLGLDQVPNDGVYWATWTPTSGGSFQLQFPDGSVVLVTVDPYLKPGFPVQAFQGPGSYHGGQAVHTLVGNIDGDPALEILATGLAQGPLYAWNADGTPVPGWPVVDIPGAAYPALGELAAGEAGLEVFSAHYGPDPDLVARTGSALTLRGWPRTSANYVATPPTLADVDGDGVDEIFTEEEDWHLHAYRAEGAPLAGWPTIGYVGGQERHTPAVADLDGDRDLEIVTVSGRGNGLVNLFAYHHDGSPVNGFPIEFEGDVDTFPVIGDVDGDRQIEIVVAGRMGAGRVVRVFSANGALEADADRRRELPLWDGTSFGRPRWRSDARDLVQTETAINVWKGDGSVFPGWPVSTGTDHWLNHAGPVVGDVDGDGQPDVVALALANSGNAGDVLVFRANGSLLWSKRLEGLGSGAVPPSPISTWTAAARSSSPATSGTAGRGTTTRCGPTTSPPRAVWPDRVGQFMGGRVTAGCTRPNRSWPDVPDRGQSWRRRRHSHLQPAGIDCGSDCSERYLLGTTVVLTATLQRARRSFRGTVRARARAMPAR